MIPSSFHFLRPEWLLALFPAALIVAFALNRLRAVGAGDWGTYVDPHLMAHLAVKGAPPRGSRSWVVALGLALGCMVLAMAGPTWQKLPVPAYGGAQPTVVVLSLAQSMNSTDLVPSRIARAGHKLRDILDQTKGGDVALVVYADRPFVAAPLTSDGEVIRQMLPELSTGLMPVLGNRLDLAIAEAQGLLTRAGASSGRIVVMADDTGLDAAASIKAAATAKAAGFTVSVLGLGTADGANLQTAQGQAIRAQDGSMITAKLDVAGLTTLAQSGGGAFSTVTADGSDLAKLLPPEADVGQTSAQGKPVDLITDSWNDMGYILLLLPVLLAPFAFRRGLLFVLPLLALGAGMEPSGARAGTWADMWKTPDQQGQAAFAAGDFAKAADAFASPDHKASAYYRAGDFAAAAAAYGAGQTAQSYNLGNALAKSGKFKEALAAYDQALTAAPKDPDTLFNRDVVAKLLEQQKQQDQQKQDQQQKQDKSQDPSKPQDSKSQPQGGGDKAGDKQENAQNGSQPDSAEPSDGQQAKDGQSGKPSDQPAGDKPGQQAAHDNAAQGQPQDANSAKPDKSQPASTAQATPGAEQAKPAEAPQGQASPTDAATDAQQADLKADLDKALAAKAQGEGKPTDQTANAKDTGQTLDQATEQQLRAVPDDPSGLLRARIHQYYASLRAAGQ